MRPYYDQNCGKTTSVSSLIFPIYNQYWNRTFSLLFWVDLTGLDFFMCFLSKQFVKDKTF